MDNTIHIHPVFLTIIISVIFTLIGTIWLLLNARLKKVEDWKVDKGFLKTKLELLDEKFNGIEHRIDDWKTYDRRDHERLEQRLVSMGESIEEIKDCMNKLAQKKEC